MNVANWRDPLELPYGLCWKPLTQIQYQDSLITFPRYIFLCKILIINVHQIQQFVASLSSILPYKQYNVFFAFIST